MLTRLLMLSCAAGSAFAALEGVFVEQRHDMPGAYERIVGAAVYGASLRIEYSVIKPRDPATSNGALIVLTGGSVGSESLMNRGYTLLRMKTVNPEEVREFVSYLRYGSVPVKGFALGDQRRSLKRALIVGPARSVETVVSTNSNAQGKPYFEGAVITDKKSFTAPDKLRLVQVKGRPEDTVLKLDAELAASAK